MLLSGGQRAHRPGFDAVDAACVCLVSVSRTTLSQPIILIDSLSSVCIRHTYVREKHTYTKCLVFWLLELYTVILQGNKRYKNKTYIQHQNL